MSQILRGVDLGIDIKQTIVGGPNKWDLIVSLADYVHKGTRVEFSCQGPDSLEFKIRVGIWELAHECGIDHRWKFMGVATLNNEEPSSFWVRGYYSSQTRDGFVSRVIP